MITARTTVIPAKRVRSLVWEGDSLVDWVAGGARFASDGTITPSGVCYAYRFDAACSSPSGEFTVLYERLGTKGLVLRQGKILREIDHSFYCADDYEFPVTIGRLATGREVLIHCPKEYNQLEIENIETGEVLTAVTERKPSDYFHSRLATKGTMLSSAGWVWHPYGALGIYRLADALADPSHLDHFGLISAQSSEISSAAFLNEHRIALSTSDETFADEEEQSRPDVLRPNVLAIWDLDAQSLVSQVAITEPVGTMMPLDSQFVVGFHEYPKVFDLKTGQIVWRLPELSTGRQTSCIIHHLDPIPPIALDPERKRFAVAAEDGIYVVELSEALRIGLGRADPK